MHTTHANDWRWVSVEVEHLGHDLAIALAEPAYVVAHADGIPVLIEWCGEHVLLDLSGRAVATMGAYRLRLRARQPEDQSWPSRNPIPSSPALRLLS